MKNPTAQLFRALERGIAGMRLEAARHTLNTKPSEQARTEYVRARAAYYAITRGTTQ